MADLQDFSSFNPAEEKLFVPFERAMRDNGKRADTFGYAVAGGLFVVVALIVQMLYTPCTRFCDRPPITCTTDSEIAAFKRSCTDSCRSLQRESGLAIKREVKNESTGKMDVEERAVDGTEFVDNLASCSFAGGAGFTCEEITKKAETKGLWCPKK